MAVKRAETLQNVETELHNKRCAADKKRDKIFQDKIQKIKKHVTFLLFSF